MNKQLVSALLASSALASLGGCSEGDQATIIIEAPAADSPAPAPAQHRNPSQSHPANVRGHDRGCKWTV